MSTSLNWIGGGNNQASNAKDWSPAVAPAPGDTLDDSISGTMNITGAALAGDILNVFPPGVTLNLSNATLDAIANFEGGDTFNLTGNNRFNLDPAMPSPGGPTITINMGKNATLTGEVASNFQPGGDPVIINGGTYINDASETSEAQFMTFNCNVEGTGTLIAGGTLTFLGAVGAGQTIAANGIVDIGDPGAFAGTIGGAAQGPGGTPHVPIEANTDFIGQINLTGLLQTASYTFTGNVLTLFNANDKAIDTLNIDTSGVSVDATSTGVTIFGGGATPGSGYAGTAVPVQSADLTWVGGGNNQASNSKNWSPNQLPASGGTLMMDGGTMNVQGATLAGDSLYVVGGPGVESVNLTNATLTSISSEGATINLTGNNSFELEGGGVVNMGKNATWAGKIYDDQQPGDLPLTVNGGTYINDSTQTFSSESSLVFNTNISGTGALVGSPFTFLGAVGAGQTIASEGILTIGDPTAFEGTIEGAVYPGPTPHVPMVATDDFIGQITLAGLLQSNSYSFKNDILTLFNANKIVDSVTIKTTGVTVDKTSAGISIFAGGDTSPSGFTGIAMPVHA